MPARDDLEIHGVAQGSPPCAQACACVGELSSHGVELVQSVWGEPSAPILSIRFLGNQRACLRDKSEAAAQPIAVHFVDLRQIGEIIFS